MKGFGVFWFLILQWNKSNWHKMLLCSDILRIILLFSVYLVFRNTVWWICAIKIYHILWDIRSARSSTVTNLFQSWVPGFTNLKRYSAPTIAAAYEKTVWLIVVITREPPGWVNKINCLNANINFFRVKFCGYPMLPIFCFDPFMNSIPCSSWYFQ